jgi:hypothetical protein
MSAPQAGENTTCPGPLAHPVLPDSYTLGCAHASVPLTLSALNFSMASLEENDARQD